MDKVSKTNAARLLDRAKIAYELIPYEVDPDNLAAEHVAEELGGEIREWGRAGSADRLYPWRLLSTRDEKAFPDIFPFDSNGFSVHICLGRAEGITT